jgi:peptide/nickel transport system substrate-binding protein
MKLSMRNSGKGWLLPVALTVALAASASACAGSSGSSGASGSSSEALTVALGALPSNGDPDVDSSLIASAPFGAIYDTLVVLKDGKIMPHLATAWKSTSATTWELTLRTGATFSDGSPFNAEVAAWNLNRTLDPKTNTTRPLTDIASATALSPTVLKITTAVPLASFMNRLLDQFMKSEKAYKSEGANAFATAPVGTGPFVVSQWVRDDHITLKRNDRYWNGTAKLDSLTFKMIPDTSTRVAELQTGESDVVYQIPAQQAKTLKSDSTNIVNVPLAQTLVLYLRNNLNTPLKDPRVREAIAYGVDVNAIAKATLGNYAQLPVSGGLATPGSFGYNPDLKAFPYDPGKAKQLLAEAGYPNGFSVEFNSSQGRYAQDSDAAQIVANQLGEIGIKVKVTFLESGVYLDKLFNQGMAPMYVMGTNSAPWYDNGLMCSMFEPPIHMSDPAQNLCQDAAKIPTIFDDTARKAEIFKLDQERHSQALAIQLYQLPGIYGISKKVKGLGFNADYSFANYLTVEISS